LNDRVLGALLTIASIVILVVWLYWLFFLPSIQFWAVALPVIIGVVVLAFIGMWIGWTMATTPPPTPIEETPVTPEEKKPEKTEEKKPAKA